MQREGSGYQFPSLRLCPSAPPHLFTFLCPYLEISRSPPPHLCGVQTLSPPLQWKKAGPTHWDALDLTLAIVCWLKAMSVRVQFRSVQSSSGCALARTIFPTHLAAAMKVTGYLFMYLSSWNKLVAVIVVGGMRHGWQGKGGFFKEGWGASRLHAPCLKECYKRDLLRRKTPCGADPLPKPEPRPLKTHTGQYICVIRARGSFGWRGGVGAAFTAHVGIQVLWSQFDWKAHS